MDQRTSLAKASFFYNRGLKMLENKYFTVQQLVKKGLGSKAKIHRLISSGKLRSFKLGRSRKIAESAVEEYLNANQK